MGSYANEQKPFNVTIVMCTSRVDDLKLKSDDQENAYEIVSA
jgi:hypothetical protein